jgi:hypothetical protein
LKKKKQKAEEGYRFQISGWKLLPLLPEACSLKSEAFP